MSEEKQEIEIDLENAFCVILSGIWCAIFPDKVTAQRWVNDRPVWQEIKDEYQIQPITAKVEFTPEQIQAELSKRCAAIEQSNSNSFVETNTKLFRRGNV